MNIEEYLTIECLERNKERLRIKQMKKNFTKKEWILHIIRQFCFLLYYLPHKIGNWATDKINKSYYNLYPRE